MPFSAWLSEFNRILFVFVPCTLIGLITGHLPFFFILGLIIYGLWTARQLVTLEQWLDGGALVDEAPEFLGIADQHISSIVNLQKTHRVSKTELQNSFKSLQGCVVNFKMIQGDTIRSKIIITRVIREIQFDDNHFQSKIINLNQYEPDSTFFYL